MLYAAVTLTDEFDVLPQKKNELRLDLNRALGYPSEVIFKRARVALERVRANFDITCRRRQRLPRLQLVRTNFDITFFKSTLLSRQTRSRTPIRKSVKGY